MKQSFNIKVWDKCRETLFYHQGQSHWNIPVVKKRHLRVYLVHGHTGPEIHPLAQTHIHACTQSQTFWGELFIVGVCFCLFFTSLRWAGYVDEKSATPTLCSCVATKVWKPGATPKPSSWTNGGSAWLWICTRTPASKAVSSGREETWKDPVSCFNEVNERT